MNAVSTTEQKAPPPPIEKIPIKVDGRGIEVPKSMPDWQGKLQPITMLQACQLAGVEVPHYCYHPKLPIAGKCRMCMIEFGTLIIDTYNKKPLLIDVGTHRIYLVMF